MTRHVFGRWTLLVALGLLSIAISSTSAHWWYLGMSSKHGDFGKQQLEQHASPYASAALSSSEANNNNVNIHLSEDKRAIRRHEAEDVESVNPANSATYVIELRKYCRDARILTSDVQRKLCHRNVKLVNIMSRAAALAIDQCQHQFRFKRWNCTVFNKTNVFGSLIRTRSRETAFVYAINAAAAMYETTKACARGELSKCSCNQQTSQTMSDLSSSSSSAQSNGISIGSNAKQFQWGGCSDNVLFGHKLSKYFVDSIVGGPASESRVNQEYKMMSLHNNEVGRRTILRNMKQVCKCHGVSGSCSLKVCWKVMPDFRLIGKELFKRYSKAAQITEARARDRIEKLRLIVNRRSTSAPSSSSQSKEHANYKDELVFIERSPNFCKRDQRLDTLGTKGRICSIVGHPSSGDNMATNTTTAPATATSQDETSIQTCDYLCCGRGYSHRVVEVTSECDCQFQWCCSVKCKKCTKRVIEYYCN